MHDKSRIDAAVSTLQLGGIIAYPTEGVWGLGCDPDNQAAVERLLQLKSRPVSKGLILVAATLKQLGPLFDRLAPELGSRLEKAVPGPDTWLIPDPDQEIPDWIRGKFSTVAIRVSKHPVVRELCEGFGGMIVSTSANPAGRDPALSVEEVRAYFPDQLDCIVPGDLGGRQGPSRILDLRSGEAVR